MGMFNGKININEGKKYDATQVAMEGMSKEEIEAAIKKNNKLIDIYKAYDADRSGSLNKIELARAMDGFAKTADINGDGKLSKKELEAYAEAFNKQNGLDGENAVRGKDIKAFIKSVRKATKDDTKVQTKDVIAKAEAQERLQAEVDKAINSFVAGMEKQAKAREEAEAARAQAEADAAAQAKAKAADLKQPKSYTVQPNERLDSILKRSLKAQGLEVNEKNMAEAKAEFIKNNPKALHGPKGKEYLYQGDVIKIAGNLEDKGNANEIKAAYQKAQADAKAKAQAEAEAQAKARAEAEAREQARREAGEVPYPAKASTTAAVPTFEVPSFMKNDDALEVKIPYAPPSDKSDSKQDTKAPPNVDAQTLEQVKKAAAEKVARLNKALEDLSPASKPPNEGQLPYNYKIEKLTKENTELLDEIAKADNPAFAARALMAAAKGSGTNDVLLEAVLNAGKDKKYYQQIDEILKKQGTSLYSLARRENLSMSPLDISDNKYYKEFIRNHWNAH